MAETLANQLRPTSFADVVGQEHLVGPHGVITKMIAKDRLMSMILFGPAGTGKTTIANIIVEELNYDHAFLNATQSNKKDMQTVIEQAKLSTNFILVLDEIHRLNKDKQDILLPHIESGLITLIGLTNSNPYHSINTAIRSRVLLLEVRVPDREDIIAFLKRVITKTKIKRKDYDKIINHIVRISNNDIRYSINQLEMIDILYDQKDIDDILANLHTNISIDKNESYYYDAISSLQKSVRGSDVNAALFYLAILIIAEDLDIIERRLSVMAYEDVGLANPAVVDRTLNALRVARMVGFPEARIPLAFSVVDLALSPKSNQAYQAIDQAIDTAKNTHFTFNEYMRATPKNPQDRKNYWRVPYDQRYLIQYLPDQLKDTKFYQPLNKTKYEQYLTQMNNHLNSIKRTNDIEGLLKKIKKKG